MLGPTAFGTTRKRFWELLWLSSVTDFRMRYINAVLGYFWALMRPLLVVRDHLPVPAPDPELRRQDPQFRPDADDQHHPVPVLRGGHQSGHEGARLQGSPGEEDAVPPGWSSPTTSLTAAITLVLNLLVGTVLLFGFGLTPTVGWLALPLAAIVLVVFATGVSLILSVAFVRLPDVGQLWTSSPGSL